MACLALPFLLLHLGASVQLHHMAEKKGAPPCHTTDCNAWAGYPGNTIWSNACPGIDHPGGSKLNDISLSTACSSTGKLNAGDRVEIVPFGENYDGHVGGRGELIQYDDGDVRAPYRVQLDNGDNVWFEAGSVKLQAAVAEGPAAGGEAVSEKEAAPGKDLILQKEEATGSCNREWCDARTKPWEQKCSWADCKGCSNCATVCPQWCTDSKLRWEVMVDRLTWKACKPCLGQTVKDNIRPEEILADMDAVNGEASEKNNNKAITYTKISDSNCFDGDSGTSISNFAMRMGTVQECKEHCTNDVDCGCFAYRTAYQTCLQRSDCGLSDCIPSNDWDVYVKETQFDGTQAMSTVDTVKSPTKTITFDSPEQNTYAGGAVTSSSHETATGTCMRAWCDARTRPWAQKCSWEPNCKGCSDCAIVCPQWCIDHKLRWEVKLTWKACKPCQGKTD